jgi:TfoX/Sxy family transcriptional regulator of competence genes
MKAALKPDRFWKKSRIAARILLKQQRRPLNVRDRRLARQLADDPEVLNRLIHQAINWLKAPPNHAH